MGMITFSELGNPFVICINFLIELFRVLVKLVRPVITITHYQLGITSVCDLRH